MWRPTRIRRAARLVLVAAAAVAERRHEEQDTGDDGQRVADDSHPVAPAEVRIIDGIARWVERLTEVLAVLGRIGDGVVRLFRCVGAEHCQRRRL